MKGDIRRPNVCSQDNWWAAAEQVRREEKPLTEVRLVPLNLTLYPKEEHIWDRSGENFRKRHSRTLWRGCREMKTRSG